MIVACIDPIQQTCSPQIGAETRTAPRHDFEMDPARGTRPFMTAFHDQTLEAFGQTRHLVLRGGQRGFDEGETTPERARPSDDAGRGLHSGLAGLDAPSHREGRAADALRAIPGRRKDDRHRGAGVNGPGTGTSAAMNHAAKAGVFRQ